MQKTMNYHYQSNMMPFKSTIDNFIVNFCKKFSTKAIHFRYTTEMLCIKLRCEKKGGVTGNVPFVKKSMSYRRNAFR
ncbi:hypothetical protein O9A_00317 [Bartonella koehlerae C-29]|uniref:Uncharacterized protein n=1 Tax=Bartonella koehlerae C-29 TaxID=1134510 RepID=A0A067WJK2_9HYPH|nr:hypothetical protein O9A_00317 [Bartonella koehlerae C-29]